MSIMYTTFFMMAVIAVAMGVTEEKLKIDVTHSVDDCTRKTANGDRIHMHYTGKLSDGTKFDSSYDRDEPLDFTLGAGQVISGWERGLTEMCVGEKRTLTIPPSMAYGDRGIPGTIPPSATLHFDVELVFISGEENQEKEL